MDDGIGIFLCGRASRNAERHVEEKAASVGKRGGRGFSGVGGRLFGFGSVRSGGFGLFSVRAFKNGGRSDRHRRVIYILGRGINRSLTFPAGTVKGEPSSAVMEFSGE